LVSASTAGLQAIGVAQDREAVTGADGEGVEAVEVRERSFQRLARLSPSCMRQVRYPAATSVSLSGAEADAAALQALAQPVVVGQRAVVHQAKIEPGRERVRVLGGNRALGRHAGMAEGMAAGDLAQAEAIDHSAGQTHLLVDLDGIAGAHDSDLGMILGEPAGRAGEGRGNDQARMAGAPLERGLGAERHGDVLGEPDPGIVRIGMEQRQLDPAVGRRRPVDGDAGAVRAAVAELDQHARQPVAEARLQRRILEVETDNAAHRNRSSADRRPAF